MAEGVEELGRSVAINPEMGYFHLQLAFLHAVCRDLEGAEAAGRLIELNQEMGAAYLRLGFREEAERRFQEARKAF
jgi:hypothetical protein